MRINYRNLAILAIVTLPIGFLLGLYVTPAIGLWWGLIVSIPAGLFTGLLIGLLGFRIRG